MEYLYPHLINQVTFVTPAPRHENNHHNLMLVPFDYSVWYLFLLSLFVYYIWSKLFQNLNGTGKIFWISILVLFRQPCHKWTYKQRINSVNIMLLFWNVSMFILTTTYASCLYSIIAIPPDPGTIDTVDQLFEEIIHGRIVVNSVKNSFYTDTFRVSFFQ